MINLYLSPLNTKLLPNTSSKSEVLGSIGNQWEYFNITFKVIRNNNGTRTTLGTIVSEISGDYQNEHILKNLPSFIGGNLEIEISSPGDEQSNGSFTRVFTLAKNCWFKGGTVILYPNVLQLYDDDGTLQMVIGKPLPDPAYMWEDWNAYIIADVYEIKPKTFYTPPAINGFLTDILPTVSARTNLTPIGEAWNYEIVGFTGLGANAGIGEEDDPHQTTFNIVTKNPGTQLNLILYGDDGTDTNHSLNAPFGIPAQTVTLGVAVESSDDSTDETDWLYLGGITNQNSFQPNVTSFKFSLWPYEILPTSGVNPLFMGVM